jgi:hypothetical protein
MNGLMVKKGISVLDGVY